MQNFPETSVVYPGEMRPTPPARPAPSPPSPSGAVHPEDLDLARRAASGEAEAWDELVATYGRRLYNVAVQFAGDGAAAEDLTQEIFLKLYARLAAYDGSVPLAGWALRVSRNLCIDRYRRARRHGRGREVDAEVLERLPAAGSVEERAERRERLALVYRVLAELPESQSMVLALRDLQGMSYEEVATFLGLPMGTVKSLLFRARRELARRVEERLGGPGGPAGAEEAAGAAGRPGAAAKPARGLSRGRLRRGEAQAGAALLGGASC